MPSVSAISRVPQRWIVCVLCSWAFAFISYKNYSLHEIFVIVDTTTEQRGKPSGCPFLYSRNFWIRKVLPFPLPDLFWNRDVMDLAKSAHYIGKYMMIVPAGMVSDLGFSKYVLWLGMFLVAGRYFLMPALAHLGANVYIALNSCDGVGEALIYPSIFTIISHWVPPGERNFFTTFVIVGIIYGDTLGHVFFKLTYLKLESWAVGHCITGTVVLLWLALSYLFIYHSPDESPFRHVHGDPPAISNQRRMTLPIGVRSLHGIPWLKIVCSRPYLSLVLAFCSIDWVTWDNIWKTFQDYQQYILHLPEDFSDESSAMVIAFVPASVLGGWFADWIINHKVMSKTAVIKIFTFIGVYFSSLLQVAALSVGCNITAFWILFIVSVYNLGLATVIYSNPIDLSGKHAGLLIAIMFGFRTVFAFFKRKVDKIILADKYSPGHWWNYTLFNSVLSAAMLIPFLVFGSGQTQQWTPHETEESNPHPAESPSTSTSSNTRFRP